MQNMEIKLPEKDLRKVIGIWSMEFTDMAVNRAIELSDEKYYIVSHTIDGNGTRIGGDTGLPIERISDVEYRGIGLNKLTYRISVSGKLECFMPGERTPVMVGAPCVQIWPN